MGSCVGNGTGGILFNVSAGSTTRSQLTVYAGSIAAAAGITATLIDGDTTTVFEEHVNAVCFPFPQLLPWQLQSHLPLVAH